MMNPTLVTAVVGLLTIGFGLIGLFKPGTVMGTLGLETTPADRATVMGEMRAVYGGMPLVLGAFTLHAALDPAKYRSRLVLLGLVWLGVCAGRLFSVTIDGAPGIVGWGNAALELAGGALLLVASRAPSAEARREAAQAAI
jgi:hypothetical protein